jgi:serine/threonine protein kinase
MATVETLGKYEIKRQLGRGAMGTVYEGWDPIIERRVAIKTVSLPDATDPETEEALARFRREAQAAGRLTHPNIVGVFDYGETAELAYIVMEYVDGPPLKNLLDKQERFTVPTTVRIMEDLLAGLKFSHDRGVVHRDIKPANVMLTLQGQAKIADFGIARIESSSMTQAGTVMGTPAYMSPEQIMGQVVDARSDIYSSGVLLYQLLTGERPFEGGMSAIMHKALNTEPPLPSQISVTSPAAFDPVVRKAMAKRPEDRFGTAADFAAAVRDAAAGRAPMDQADDEATMVAAPSRASSPPPTAPRPAPVQRPAATPVTPPKKSAMPLIAGAVVAAVLLLGGGAWFFFLGGEPTQVPPPRVATVVPSPQPPPIEPVPPPVVVAPPVVAPPSVTETTPPVVAPQPEPISSPAALDALRHRITQLVAAQRCAVVEGDLRADGGLTLKGLAGSGTSDELRAGLDAMAIPGALDWQVGRVDDPFCPALDILHPISRGFGAIGPKLTMDLVGGNTRLRDGDHIRPRLVMADFRGHLRADYIAHDGTVLHLYPQISDSKQGIAADQPHIFAPGEPLALGEVSQGHPAWEVAEPYGSDLIIAIVSAQPLFPRDRPNNVEKASDYLRDLRTAVDGALHRGVRMMGTALVVETLPK